VRHEQESCTNQKQEKKAAGKLEERSGEIASKQQTVEV
jgi:hypothetical protein